MLIQYVLNTTSILLTGNIYPWVEEGNNPSNNINDIYYYYKMSKSKQTDIYDVNKYSNKELYSILDLNSPTDRELEAKILFYTHKYENTDPLLYKFFNDIYDNFLNIL